MSSQISTIIDTIGATAVGGITAIPANQTPDTFDSWRFPCRVILPISGRGSGESQRVTTFKDSSGRVGLVIDWTISDLFFLRAADAGVGLADGLPQLIDYCGAYASAVAQLRTPKWSVTNVSFPIIGPLEWPSGGRTYDAVQAQIIVRELI